MTPDQLRQLVAGLPEGGSVTLPRGELAELCDRLDVIPLPVVSADGDRLLFVPETARRMGVAARWLYRHAATLPFTRRLGRRTLRFSERGLAQWLTQRR